MGKISAILFLASCATLASAQHVTQEAGDDAQIIAQSPVEPEAASSSDRKAFYSVRLEAIDESSPDYVLLVQVEADAMGEDQTWRPLIEWRTQAPGGGASDMALRPIGPGVWGEKIQGPIEDGKYEIRLILLRGDSDGRVVKLHETDYKLSLPELEVETLATRSLGSAEVQTPDRPPAESQDDEHESPRATVAGWWIAGGAAGMLVFLSVAAVSGYTIRRWKKARRGPAKTSPAEAASEEAVVQAVDEVVKEAGAEKKATPDGAELNDLSF